MKARFQYISMKYSVEGRTSLMIYAQRKLFGIASVKMW